MVNSCCVMEDVVCFYYSQFVVSVINLYRLLKGRIFDMQLKNGNKIGTLEENDRELSC